MLIYYRFYKDECMFHKKSHYLKIQSILLMWDIKKHMIMNINGNFIHKLNMKSMKNKLSKVKGNLNRYLNSYMFLMDSSVNIYFHINAKQMSKMCSYRNIQSKINISKKSKFLQGLGKIQLDSSKSIVENVNKKVLHMLNILQSCNEDSLMQDNPHIVEVIQKF